MAEFLNLFDKSPIVVFEWKKIKSWVIVSVTPNVKNLIGYTSKEILGDNFNYLDLLSSEDQINIRNQIVLNLKSQNNDFNLEIYKLKNKKNEIIWVYTYIHVKRNNENKIESFLGYIIDVTKNKKDEIELKEAKEKHQIISESTIDGIFILDKIGNMIFLNQGMLNITGRPMEELKDVHFSKYVPKSELPKYLLTLKNIFLKRKIENFSTKIIRKDNSILDVEINGKLVKLNGKWVAQGSMRDISLRKKMSQSLKESEERFRIMFENNSIPTLFGDFSLLEEFFEETRKQNKNLSDFLLF